MTATGSQLADHEQHQLRAALAYEAAILRAHHNGIASFPARARALAEEQVQAIERAIVEEWAPAQLRELGRQSAAAIRSILAYKTFPTARRHLAEQQVARLRDLDPETVASNYAGVRRLDSELAALLERQSRS